MPNLPQFVGDLNLQPLEDGRHWRLLADFSFRDIDGKLYTTPANLVTDFASIPALNRIGMGVMAIAHLLSWIHVSGNLIAAFGAWLIWIASSLRPWGVYGRAAVIHDGLFAQQTTTLWATYGIFWRAMQITATARWERIVIFLGVLLGGWWAWREDGRRLKNGAARCRIIQPQ